MRQEISLADQFYWVPYYDDGKHDRRLKWRRLQHALLHMQLSHIIVVVCIATKALWMLSTVMQTLSMVQ